MLRVNCHKTAKLTVTGLSFDTKTWLIFGTKTTGKQCRFFQAAFHATKRVNGCFNISKGFDERPQSEEGRHFRILTPSPTKRLSKYIIVSKTLPWVLLWLRMCLGESVLLLWRNWRGQQQLLHHCRGGEDSGGQKRVQLRPHHLQRLQFHQLLLCVNKYNTHTLLFRLLKMGKNFIFGV